MARNAVAFEALDFQSGDKPMPAGAYYFMRVWKDGEITEEVGGWIHGCPCGCGRRSAMWFEGHENAGGPKWSVTGDFQKATMNPSIGIGRGEAGNGGFHWHGYLRNGVFEEC